MRWHVGVVALLIAAASAAVAEEPSKEELRKQVQRMIELPDMTITHGVEFSIFGDGSLPVPKSSLPAKIDQLQKELKGDASDAERYCRLGKLYRTAGQKPDAEKADEQAVALARAQLKQHPGDPMWLIVLGEALPWKDETDEATQCLRQAVRAAPQSRRAWLALGAVLQCHSLSAMMKAAPKGIVAQLVQWLQSSPPAAEQLQAWRRLNDEAESCFTRAIALDPLASKPYVQRGATRALGLLIQARMRLQAQQSDDLEKLLFAPAVVADIRQGARLTHENSLLIAIAIAAEIELSKSPAAAKQVFGEQKPTPPPAAPTNSDLDKLPAPVRQSVCAHLAHLEKITAHSDPDVAAAAAKSVAYVYYELEDNVQTERWSRKSVALAPADDVARKLLIFALMCNDHGDEAVRLLQGWLKQRNSAFCHYMLAFCYDWLGKFHQVNKAQQVEEALAAGLKAFPDDFLLNLSKAACLLRKGDPASLTAAGELLDRFEGEVGHGPSDEKRKENFNRLRQAHAGLTGDEAAARAAVKRLKR